MSDTFDALPSLPTAMTETSKKSKTGKAGKSKKADKGRPGRETGRGKTSKPEGESREFRGMDQTRDILGTTLELAVPWRILELRDLTPEQRTARGPGLATIVGSHGDALMFRSKKHTPQAFNALAEGLAIAAYQPGGVTLFGRHWCVDPHWDYDRDTWCPAPPPDADQLPADPPEAI